MKAAQRDPKTVEEIRYSKGRTDFFLADNSHYDFRKGEIFCWLMAGDVVTVRKKGSVPPAAQSAANSQETKQERFRRSASRETQGVLIDSPALVEAGSGDDALWGYLEDCCRSHDAVNTVFRALRAKLGEARHLEWYDQICEWSQGGSWRRVCAPLLSDKGVVDAKAAEIGLERLFARWHRRQTLRRVYNLQIFKKELNGSFLGANDCYHICRRNPFLVPSLTAVKAKLICSLFGISVTKEMLAMGEVLRCLKEQFDSYRHFAVREDRLVAARPEYPAVAEALAAESAVTVLETKKPLVCLTGLYRMMERVSSCLREAPSPPVTYKVSNWNDESLTREQKYAVGYALVAPVSPIKGRAGTGKTRVIAELVYQVQSFRQSWRVAVFTGKATSRVKEALTQAHVPFEEDRITTIHRLIYSKAEPCNRLIFDEASMISTSLFNQLVGAKPWVRQAQLTFVADENQLPPIAAGRFFDQILLSPIRAFVLTKNFRTEGKFSGIAAFADWVLAAKAADSPPLGDYPSVELINGGVDHAKKLLKTLLQGEGAEPSAAPTDEPSAPRKGESATDPPLEVPRRSGAEDNSPSPCKVEELGDAERESCKGESAADPPLGVPRRGEAEGNPPSPYKVEEPEDAKRESCKEGNSTGESATDPPLEVPRHSGAEANPLYKVEEPEDAPPEAAQTKPDEGFAPKQKKSAFTPANFKVICPYRRETAQLCVYLRELFGFGEDGVTCPGSNRVYEVGERVIMTYNDRKANIFNGEEGVVISVKKPGEQRESLLTANFNFDKAIVEDPAYLEGAQKERMKGSKVVEFYDVPARKKESDDDVEEITIEGGDFDDGEGRKEGDKDNASFHELEYAYALTVHKAQGSEWKSVMVVVPGGACPHLLVNPLFYTAVTRAREQLWVICTHRLMVQMARTPLEPNCDPTHLLMYPDK